MYKRRMSRLRFDSCVWCAAPDWAALKRRARSSNHLATCADVAARLSPSCEGADDGDAEKAYDAEHDDDVDVCCGADDGGGGNGYCDGGGGESNVAGDGAGAGTGAGADANDDDDADNANDNKN